MSKAYFRSGRNLNSSSRPSRPSSSRCVLSVSCAGVMLLPLIFMPLPPQAACQLPPPLGRWNRESARIVLVILYALWTLNQFGKADRRQLSVLRGSSKHVSPSWPHSILSGISPALHFPIGRTARSGSLLGRQTSRRSARFPSRKECPAIRATTLHG